MGKVALFTVLTLLLMTGCDFDEKSTVGSAEVSGLKTSESTDYSKPELIETEDSISYRFERKTVASNLYLDKTIVLNKDGSGKIMLDFSGNGDGEYIETIPKSFASYVDDIEFSVEPDEIINPDPQVRWVLNKAKGKVKRIIMEVKETAKAATDLANRTLAAGAEFNNLLTGKEVDYSQIDNKARLFGVLAGANEVLMNKLDDFLFLADIQVCADKSTEQERMLCILTLVSNEPDWFECEEIYEKYDEYGTDKQILIHSCKAIQKDDPSICEGAQFYDHEEYRGTEASYVAICQRQFFTIKLLACEGLFKDEKEQCVIDKIMGTGYKDACWSLDEESSERCVAAAEGKEIKKSGPSETKSDGIETKGLASTPTPTPTATQNAEKSEEEDCSSYEKETTRNMCYTSKAEKSGQISFCNMVTGPTSEKEQEYTWSCYWKVAMAIPDCSICDMIAKSNYRFRECIYQCSAKSMDPEVCEKLESSLNLYSVELCKGSVAERKEDSSICDGLKNEDAKNDCYDKVASRKQDPSICEKISVESDKETCKKYAIPS
jgi:hypothetical protein